MKTKLNRFLEMVVMALNAIGFVSFFEIIIIFTVLISINFFFSGRSVKRIFLNNNDMQL